MIIGRSVVTLLVLMMITLKMRDIQILSISGLDEKSMILIMINTNILKAKVGN